MLKKGMGGYREKIFLYEKDHEKDGVQNVLLKEFLQIAVLESRHKIRDAQIQSILKKGA